MPMRPLTICALLRKAFLRGVPLNVASFADKREFERESVYSALKQFGDLVYSDAAHNWHCRDMQKMRAFETPERQYRRARRAENDRRRREVKGPDAWAALLTAWGIQLTPPESPKGTIHTMATAEDNKLEQEA